MIIKILLQISLFFSLLLTTEQLDIDTLVGVRMSDVNLGILFCFEANVVFVLTVELQREVECVVALSLLNKIISDSSRLLLLLF